MAAKVLISRPDHDDETFYLSEWSRSTLVEVAKSRGLEVLDLHRRKSNRSTIESYISKNNPDFLVFNGHGDKDNIMGQDNEVLIKKGKNDQFLQNRITHSIACEAGSGVGRRCCVNDRTAFVGYSRKFAFLSDNSKSNRPLEDGIARPFFETSLAVPEAILRGNTVEEAMKKSKRLFVSWIEKLLASDTVEGPHIIPVLMWNMSCQVAHGNTELRIG